MEADAEKATLVMCPNCRRPTTTETGYCYHCGYPLRIPSYNVQEYKWDIYLGKTLNGERIGILSGDLVKHFLILGIVGNGKTLLAKRLLLEASRRGVNYTVLDWEGEYRDIAGLTGGLALGYEPGETPLRINLFDSGDMDPTVYTSIIFNVLYNVMKDNGWDITPQMESLLRDAVEEAVTHRVSSSRFLDIVLERAGDYPQGRHTAYALKSRLTPIFRGTVSRVFGDNETLRPLMGKRLVVDLSWLSRVSPLEARFLSRLIIGLFYHEAVRLRDSSVLRHLLVVEEAEEVLSPMGCGMEGGIISPVSYMMHLRRKGVGMVVIAHSPRLLDPSVLRIPGNIAVFRIDNYEDARYSAGMLGDGDLVGEIQSLRVGEVLLKPSSAGRPLRLMVDKPDTGSDMDYIRLINNIMNYPFLSQRDRRAMLGMPHSRYSQLVRRGIEEGLIEVVTVNTGKGRPVKLLQIKGSIPGAAHHFLLNKVKSILEREGCSFTLLERGPDVVVFRDGNSLCIEVETGTNVSIGKYLRFSRYCGSLIIVCSDRRCISRVTSSLERDPGLRGFAVATLLSGFRRALSSAGGCVQEGREALG